MKINEPLGVTDEATRAHAKKHKRSHDNHARDRIIRYLPQQPSYSVSLKLDERTNSYYAQ